jgi:hypothetical protein
MLEAMTVATLLVVLAAYLVAWALRVPGAALGTFAQGAFRGNLAFVGLPIIYALPDTAIVGGLSARTAAVIVVAPMMVAYNVGAVIVLLLSQHPLSLKMARPFLKQLATTPPLIATLAGIGCAVAGYTLPPAIDKTFSALGEMALPLGLLGVGGSIMTARLGDAWRPALGSALMKTIAAPAFGWLAGWWLGLGAIELKLIMILLATPTAVVSYTMAIEMKGDDTLASGTIVLSVFTSLVALAAIVGLF